MKHTLNLKLLPIIYVLFFALLMFMVKFLAEPFNIVFKAQTLIAIVIFITGILIILIAGYQFRNAETTVHPLKPEQTTQLVTHGIYRYSRNPMYIGFLLFLVAWVVYLGNAIALLLLPAFILVMNKVQIIPEEKILMEKFGDVYHNYMKHVRRWL